MSLKRRTPADEEFFLVRSLAAGYPGGTQVPEHGHSWHQLVYAAAGVMTVWTAEGSWITPPHWALWVPAGVSHRLRFAGATSLRTLYFRPVATKARLRQADDSGWGRPEPLYPARCVVIAVSPLLRELVLRTCELGQLDRREAEERALHTLLCASLRALPTPPFDLPLPSSPELRGLAARVAEEPALIATAAELAAQAGLGLRTLERRFLAECGVTFDHWRRRARLASALRALAGGSAVKVVAEECGYRTASAFVAAFREAFGTTPGRYFGL